MLSAFANCVLAASRLLAACAELPEPMPEPSPAKQGSAINPSKAKPSETLTKRLWKFFLAKFSCSAIPVVLSPNIAGSNCRIATFGKPTGCRKVLSGRLFVGEDNSPVRIHFFVDGIGAHESIFLASGTRTEVGVLYLLHIVSRLAIGRNPMSPVDGSLASIVRRQGQVQVAIVPFQQSPKIPHPRVHVLLGVKGVVHPEANRRRRNQLH